MLYLSSWAEAANTAGAKRWAIDTRARTDRLPLGPEGICWAGGALGFCGKGLANNARSRQACRGHVQALFWSVDLPMICMNDFNRGIRVHYSNSAADDKEVVSATSHFPILAAKFHAQTFGCQSEERDLNLMQSST